MPSFWQLLIEPVLSLPNPQGPQGLVTWSLTAASLWVPPLPLVPPPPPRWQVACLDGRVKKGYNVSNWGARFDSIRNITKRYAQGPPLAPAAPRERKAA